MIKILITAWVTSALLLATAGFASAIPITIDNASFESPALPKGIWNTSVEGWVTNSLNIHSGTYHPHDGKYTGNIVPDGNQVAFSNFYDISQILQEDLTPDTTYTLSIYVGWRLDVGFFPDYTVELLAGGNRIAAINTPVQTRGTWEEKTITFTSGSSVAPGQELEIRLVSSTSQVNFDMVRLEASHFFGSVPEPATIFILGLGMIGLSSYKRKAKNQKFLH